MVYIHRDYRKALELLIERNKSMGRKINLTRIAEAAGVQRPYISKVFSGQADFSMDQAYCTCQLLGANHEENEYILKLVEWSRSTVPDYRKKLEAEVDRLQEAQLKAAKTVAAPVVSTEPLNYYLDPMVQIIHLCLSIPRYRKNPSELSQVFSTSPERIQSILSILKTEGFIHIEGQAIKLKHEVVHLPDTSPLCGPHQTLLRVKSLERMQSIDKKEQHNFSVTFTADRSCFQRIQHKFNEFIVAVKKEVEQSKSAKAYQINFDLFPWT